MNAQQFVKWLDGYYSLVDCYDEGQPENISKIKDVLDYIVLNRGCSSSDKYKEYCLDFCYWLHGAFELGAINPNGSTWLKIVDDHLDLVFTKVTPDRDVNPKKEIEKTVVDLFKEYEERIKKDGPYPIPPFKPWDKGAYPTPIWPDGPPAVIC